MKSIETLKAEHEAALAKLQAEHDLAAKAIVPPVRVQITSGGLAHWLIYEAETLADALVIMAAAPIVPAYSYKRTFTRIQPVALADEKSGEQVNGPFAASLKIDQGSGYGPTAELRFFVMAGDQICQAHVTIGSRGRAASHWRWAANFINDPRGRSKRGTGRDEQRGEYRANNGLSAMSGHSIKWAMGSDESASFEYFWMADTEDGGADHAAAQLAIIAGEA